MTIPTPLIPVVLCGGSGTRLWPMSRESLPKQFLSLTGSGHSLLQQTLLRLNGFDAVASGASLSGAPLVVTHEDSRFLVASQLMPSTREGGKPSILLEPAGRNTAPALTIAALCAARVSSVDPLLLVMPSDHLVGDVAAFHAALTKAIDAARHDAIVTFGVVPDRPETGYGYIETAPVAGLASGVSGIASFAEKPDAQTAQRFVAGGKHLWNSGIFMMRASVWLRALGVLHPPMLEACERAMAHAEQDRDFIRPDAEAFLGCPSDSIDYAVMEALPVRAAECGATARVVALDAAWSDVGAWDALHAQLPKDAAGNAVSGPAVLHDTQRTLVMSSGRLVATVGVRDLAVVETPDAVLVADLRKTQDVKAVVAQLKHDGHTIASHHRKVHRPWGWYDSIDSGDRFQVKRIVVNPGASLSLQMHHHRAEHWVVVRGTARVVNGDTVKLLQENESTFIPLGQKHQLSNPGKVPLEIIEVQSGAYLGEDDIVRFEDAYGRHAPQR